MPPFRHRTLKLMYAACTLAVACAAAPARAQSSDLRRPAEATSETLTPQQKAEKRWPQPVRVGDLHDRLVIEPSNHQTVLGRVDGIVRADDGELRLVLRTGGLLGHFTRPVAISVYAVALLGRFVEVVDLEPAQVRALPTFDPATAKPVGADDIIRIGVTRN